MRSYRLTIPLLFIIFSSRVAAGEDYRNSLPGKRIVHEGSTCAGWSFGFYGIVVRYDELICSRGRETGRYKIKWLTPGSFVLIENDSPERKHTCPPRSYIYVIESLTADSIRLKEIDTGWGNSQDDTENFSLEEIGESGR